jgi:hypothetical protein
LGIITVLSVCVGLIPPAVGLGEPVHAAVRAT